MYNRLADTRSVPHPIQMFNVNVKAVFNEEEDTLVHIVVRGGASFLPHLLILLGHWNVQSDAPNRKGLTPLCIAAQNGSDGLAEVRVGKATSCHSMVDYAATGDVSTELIIQDHTK